MMVPSSSLTEMSKEDDDNAEQQQEAVITTDVRQQQEEGVLITIQSDNDNNNNSNGSNGNNNNNNNNVDIVAGLFGNDNNNDGKDDDDDSRSSLDDLLDRYHVFGSEDEDEDTFVGDGGGGGGGSRKKNGGGDHKNDDQPGDRRRQQRPTTSSSWFSSYSMGESPEDHLDDDNLDSISSGLHRQRRRKRRRRCSKAVLGIYVLCVVLVGMLVLAKTLEVQSLNSGSGSDIGISSFFETTFGRMHDITMPEHIPPPTHSMPTTEITTTSTPPPPPTQEEDVAVLLPERFDNLANVDELPFDELVDVPIFWHIPRSGGTTLQDDLIHCVGLVDASQIGVQIADVDGLTHENDDVLQIFQAPDGGLHVNVDTTSHDGISRAQSLGLAPSGLVDVIFTPIIYDASRLFNPTHRGRMFALFRHPVERSVSMFYHLQTATWEKTYDPTLLNMSLEDYAHRAQTEHNWMTRFLTDVEGGDLYERHLIQAKEILRTKCLVGLLSDLQVSLERFERYFGWDLNNDDGSGIDRVGCQMQHIIDGKNKGQHDYHPNAYDDDPESEALKQLKRRNYFDIQLYEYAVTLFEEQASLF